MSQKKLLRKIHLHKQTREVELVYSDKTYTLNCEYLRVNSPSAEVKGHGPGQETLQYGKKYVEIAAIEPVGNYAFKFTFNDGHDSGIYSLEYLYDLGIKKAQYWNDYMEKINQAGKSRDPDISPVKIVL